MPEGGIDLTPSDHVTPVDGEGIYRVVGTSAETVTLLLVTNGRGRRLATGHAVSVPRSVVASRYEPAPNPDAGIRPVARLRNLATGAVWEVRMLTGL